MLQLEADVESHLCVLECELDVCKERLDIYDKLREKHATKLKIVDRKLIDKFKAQMKHLEASVDSIFEAAGECLNTLTPKTIGQGINLSIAFVERYRFDDLTTISKVPDLDILLEAWLAILKMLRSKDSQEHIKQMEDFVGQVRSLATVKEWLIPSGRPLPDSVTTRDLYLYK